MPQPLIDRCLRVRDILERRSCFLFGPRQTGKSTLVRQQLSEFPTYDLLDQALFLRLSRNPGLIRETLAPDATVAVIDEIQKMPARLGAGHAGTRQRLRELYLSRDQGVLRPPPP